MEIGKTGDDSAMAEQPPREPDPTDDETVVVPPTEETVVEDDWGPESEVFVEEEQVVPRRRLPVIWPGLLALLLVVLAGLGAYYLASRDDDDAAPIATTTAATTDTAADEVRVPDVVGRPFEEAGEKLKAIGLTAVREDAFGDAPEGIVLSQDPPGGGILREGSQVTLTVSKGPESVSVPDVVGTTSSEATATLRDAGFEANVVAVPSSEPAGTVIAQNPAAGTEAAKGSRVRLNVAQPAGATTPAATTAPPATTTAPSQQQEATVPDVVGQELADAARSFAGAGLKVAVQYVPNSEPQGRVVAQAQAPGTKRKRGDTVQLNVSTGPEPAAAESVPDVVGQRQQEARKSLERAGFEVLAIEQAGNPTRVGFVLSQTPSGGAGIPRGSLVILYVGAR